jgi:hypothetical protein
MDIKFGSAKFGLISAVLFILFVAIFSGCGSTTVVRVGPTVSGYRESYGNYRTTGYPYYGRSQPRRERYYSHTDDFSLVKGWSSRGGAYKHKASHSSTRETIRDRKW